MYKFLKVKTFLPLHKNEKGEGLKEVIIYNFIIYDFFILL